MFVFILFLLSFYVGFFQVALRSYLLSFASCTAATRQCYSSMSQVGTLKRVVWYFKEGVVVL